MDASFHAAAFAGDIFARRLRVIFSTMRSSPGSPRGSMLRLPELTKMVRGCSFLAEFELGSIRNEQRVSESSVRVGASWGVGRMRRTLIEKGSLIAEFLTRANLGDLVD
jgi:hypothetical protein